MSEDKQADEVAKLGSEVEILANALADSSREANSSSKNVVRVLGTLLAFSVLGNIALAGLNISGKFFGSDIKMGSSDMLLSDESDLTFPLSGDDGPSEQDCWDALNDEGTPEDVLTWCLDIYPHLFSE